MRHRVRLDRLPTSRRAAAGRPRPGGFSLIELTVSMGVLSVIMLGVGAMFQVHTRLGRQQMQQAAMQQAARGAQNELVRMVRMAGRGGLARGLAPDFLALNVRNDVSASGPDRTIALGMPSSPQIRPATDVLTIRGVINTPLYQVAETAMTLDNPTNPTQGVVEILSPSPTGVIQDLGPLAAAIAGGISEPLLTVSSASDQIYAVVALAPGRSSVDNAAAPTRVLAAFDIGRAGGAKLADKYIAFSAGGAFSNQLRSTVFVGILEEYRYYIREQRSDPADASSAMVPRLSRGRFLAGTEQAHPSNPTLATDIADGIIDLQAAIGIDVGRDGRLDEDVTSPTATDDWLFNAAEDSPVNAGFWNPGGPVEPPLAYLRITTVARTDRPDGKFTSQPITRIEDHQYDELSYPVSEEERRERLYRRRRATTLVDLRNQG